MHEKNNNIRKIRNEKKMSGPEVAKRLGITPTYLYDLEKGKNKLGTDIAEALADMFHVSLDYLCGRITEEEEKTSAHSAQRFMNEFPDLSDRDVLDRYTLKVDGKELTSDEAKYVVQTLRTFRDFQG
ncbi:helix-turn-helix transcriptional regulator [Bacillus sp. FSL W7-1360]